MSTFDFSKTFQQVKSSKYIIPSTSDIRSIMEMIRDKFVGFLKEKSCFKLRDVLVQTMYNLVVIKNNLCIIINKVGSGAFGEVFKAYNVNTRKMVAIKRQPLQESPMIMKQAMITRQHGIGLADLESNIGPSFLADGKGYFILPLADISFNHWIVRKTISGENRIIIKALIKIGEDLKTLHKEKKVHMDLKLDNVLVLKDIAYIADFGKVEIEGTLISTAKDDYCMYPQCAPEYFCGVNPNLYYIVSHKFDLYSYGFLMKQTAKAIRDKKLALEILNISKEIHTFDPKDRKSLDVVIGYLKRLSK